MERPKIRSQVWVVEQGRGRSRSDYLATEEPLEIRLANPRRTLAITMRTPGRDFELAAGFLFAEGVVSQRTDIHRISYCVDPDVDGNQRYNIVNVELRQDLNPELQPLERHFYITSACGVCGKTSLDALKVRCAPVAKTYVVPVEVFCSLANQIKPAQSIFQATGGLHAAALFDLRGNLLSLEEDVGRHNALDKLVGSALLADKLPLDQHIVVVSGRASFEIMQKCLTAGVAIVCAVSAPSSLAVSLAQEFGMTLIGFLRDERFNIYAGKQRIALQDMG
jgi:FdhD protein